MTQLQTQDHKGKEDSWIFPTWGHTLKNFPHSECLQELAAAYHLYAYKVWYYRKHQHSHYTDCPQSFQAERVCLAFPVLHRNSHKGCWALHLEMSLVVALKVGFCWKHFVGAVVWPLKEPLVLVHLFCPPHCCCCWSFEAPGDCHSGSFLWVAPEIQNYHQQRGKIHYLQPEKLDADLTQAHYRSLEKQFEDQREHKV